MRGFSRAFSLLIFLTFLGSSHAADRLPPTARADRVIVLKSARTLTLMDHGTVLKEYKVALGGTPIGTKTRQGDHKTPEGSYILDRRNEHSQFYRSIHISYPNKQDRARAQKLKVSPGGEIMIHGLPNGYGWLGKAHLAEDWTDGCIAVTNEEIDEIWHALAEGTPIEIRP
jgi:murein L,D-transpeptidase YafK